MLRADVIQHASYVGRQKTAGEVLRPAIHVVPIYSRAEKVADMNSDGASIAGITYPGGEFAGIVNWRNLIDAMKIDHAFGRAQPRSQEANLALDLQIGDLRSSTSLF
ncbi:hypothetical protein [Erythrobacter sp. YT30]|uniref:hypothetical protein n=1 Tax=Erythrobacter sp. YT30 TaxID=1735012 RepID=UPI00076DF094|nr:hypothetical protein [Erythrobacter sp. YT30]KWV92118.1 hypothetical protein AUC45_13345 [Erythrobacter sp. YT30]